MTDKQTEALKLALEALEGYATAYSDGDEAITAIRAALASKSEALAEQPAQQQEKAPPEQWRERWYGSLAEKGWWICCGREHIAHLGTEVSSDEVRKIVDAHNRYKPTALQKEPAPQQEPVAWVCEASSSDEKHAIDYWPGDVDDLPIGTKLYTSPQSKPWVGLTDEQIEATFKRCGGRWNGDHWVIEDADLHPFVRTIEGADLNTLRAISDEYNAWIKHHAAGHSYDDFLAKREAKLRERNA